MHHENEGMFRGEAGKTPVTKAWLVQKAAEGKTSYESSRKERIDTRKETRATIEVHTTFFLILPLT